MSDCYRKHFFPLESDPAIFTELSHLLGSPASLIFEDVLSLDEAERLPHPALALVLVLPTTAVYEKRKQHEDALSDVCPQADLEEDVVWFKQTINNACGLYALLHALANSEARCMIRPSSVMARVMNAPPGQRYLIVEGSEELERVYANVATKGQSISPASAEDELDLHYVCFVRSQKNGRLYELDGDRKGPLDRGVLLPEADLLGSGVPSVIRDCIRIEADNISFSLMALVRRD